MILRRISTIFAFLLFVMQAHAEFGIKATYTDKKGVEIVTTSDISDAEAPLTVYFEAQDADLSEGATLVWHIRNDAASISVTRYEESFSFDFLVSGTTIVTLQVMDGDTELQSASLSVVISESVLEMPNAFSPNNDGFNERFQAKSTTKNIVEFHAYIFNRWGQKLFDWTDWRSADSGWDGTHNGNPVKDGVYYVYVKARGSDGRDYEIRRDVNLIRNYNTMETTTNEQ